MIDPRMIFYTYEMFFERAQTIRVMYQSLDSDRKYVYKYYIYSRRNINEKGCDIIWEYINSPDGMPALMTYGEVVKALNQYRSCEEYYL